MNKSQNLTFLHSYREKKNTSKDKFLRKIPSIQKKKVKIMNYPYKKRVEPKSIQNRKKNSSINTQINNA